MDVANGIDARVIGNARLCLQRPRRQHIPRHRNDLPLVDTNTVTAFGCMGLTPAPSAKRGPCRMRSGNQVNHNHFRIFKLAFGRFWAAERTALLCLDRGALKASARQKAGQVPLVPPLRINQRHKIRTPDRSVSVGFGFALCGAGSRQKAPNVGS
jgi:hypothetical protein